jgi:hypothetical protein
MLVRHIVAAEVERLHDVERRDPVGCADIEDDRRSFERER